MGRQISYYLVGDDEAEFMDVIRDSGGVFIDKHGTPLTRADVVLEKCELSISFPQSQIKRSSGGWLDQIDSDVIDFNRCRIQDKIIQPGRLWVELILFDESGRTYRKEKWLEDNYSYYKKWITKHCRISRDKGYYIGPATYQLCKGQGYRTGTATINYYPVFD